MSAKAPPAKEPLPDATDASELPKPARKPKAAPAAKPAPAAALPDSAKSETPVAAKPPKEDKPPKIKMVRDSFTMPETDYAQFAELKKRCLQAGLHVKKSELLRAGLKTLSQLADAGLLKAMTQVDVLKTGRPGKQK